VRSTLDELTKELKELRALVESITPLAGHQDSLVRQYVQVRRRFDYAAFVVALYASFENFVESLVAAFAQLESRRLQYTELPPKLVSKHRSQTAEMLSRGRIGEGRYVGLTELEVVKNLYDCLKGNKPYTLNEAAVVAHDSNLRVPEIDKLFRTVGIEHICERVRHADALMEWYREVKESVPRDGVPFALVEERIKDLVERRNQIAHRGGNPLDLLGVDAMREAVGFIHAFARSMFAIAVGHYLDAHHSPYTGQFELVLREGPLQRGTVVVVEEPTQPLFVGQPIFVIIDQAGARWGRIQSLKNDDSEIQFFSPENAARKGIGIGLSFKCPRNARLVVLPTDDDVVWSPMDLASAAG
jgi:RiboL-PSP-HEPN